MCHTSMCEYMHAFADEKRACTAHKICRVGGNTIVIWFLSILKFYGTLYSWQRLILSNPPFQCWLYLLIPFMTIAFFVKFLIY